MTFSKNPKKPTSSYFWFTFQQNIPSKIFPRKNTKKEKWL